MQGSRAASAALITRPPMSVPMPTDCLCPPRQRPYVGRATTASNIRGDRTGQHRTQQESDIPGIVAGKSIFAGQDLTTVPNGGAARSAPHRVPHPPVLTGDVSRIAALG